MIALLIQGLLLGGAAAAQPGPFQAYLLGQTLKNGVRRTLLAAGAPLISDGPIIALTVLVLSNMPDGAIRFLQIGGGLFLLYLAWGAWWTAKTAVFDKPPDPSQRQQSLLEAALMNALSPNPYIFWGTIAGPILITSWQQSAAHAGSFLLGFYGALVGGFVGFVVLFGVARRLDPRVARVLSILSAVVLAGFGVYQLWVGIFG